uniref:Scavenger receptor class F member 1-like n=1 Tax=Crassostrea virginica TaxID=6565 RepID=A0A8B8DB48_CRAVI|nr:scavenger receptor class F member 1-like [Crassostrea virginica]
MLILPSSTKEECLSSGNSTLCCADFYEVDGKCTPCPSGYFGPSCSHTCPYPKYGRRCLEGECQCPESMCNPTAGCVTEKSKTVENNNHIKQEPKAGVLNVDNEQKN